MPLWVYALYIVAIVIVLSLLPKRGMDFVLRSDASKIVGLTAATIGFGAVLLSYIQLSLALQDRQEDRQALREERVDRYIARLLERAPGNTGKGRAFGALLQAGEFIEGLDLSCKALGTYDSINDICGAPPEFSDIAFDNRIGGQINRASFNRSEITNSMINYLDFFRTDFEGAAFSDVYIYASTFEGNFSDAKFERAEIVNSLFDAAPGTGRPTFKMANISGSVVPWLGHLKDTELKELYFWADAPPFKFVNEPVLVRSMQDAMYEPLSKSPFYGVDILSRMNVCAPPRSPGGRRLPPIGEIVPLDRRQMLKTLGGETRALCDQPMTIVEAMRRYPEAYAITQPRLATPLSEAPDVVKRLYFPLREPW